jgi:broad specificity phosphatase PhoE
MRTLSSKEDIASWRSTIAINMATALVFVMRHSQRNKGHKSDKQTLTILGRMIAFIMGLILRQFVDNFVSLWASAQSRAKRTLRFMLRGFASEDGPETEPGIQVDERFGDFSTDTREIVQTALSAVKQCAKTHGVSSETGLFLTSEGQAALAEKIPPFMEAVRELGAQRGNHLVVCHGGTIDGACMEFCGETATGMGQLGSGGQLGYGEGFVVAFNENGQVVDVAVIRQPLWLKAIVAVADIVNV